MSKFDSILKNYITEQPVTSGVTNISSPLYRSTDPNLVSTNPIAEFVKGEISTALTLRARQTPEGINEQQVKKLLTALYNTPEFTRALEKAVKAVPDIKYPGK